ncbi:MAG: DEAD/DEAH box helicase [Xanthomonadales bacterium]|nr:DEAD/DEAH box helicase [Xanthomonadales bacterium]
MLRALSEVGYESPSPIQAATIPPLLAGRDVLGQAQTGTGKTAAFALPILARLDPEQRSPQALVLAPTRELAIQVAEAFQRYAHGQPSFHVLPIYGGQGYGPQLAALRRGVQVVVGTPGRIIDHIDRGSLKLDELRCLVLDEADEMLRMGFIDDVEKIIGQTPPERQVALFSATMPAPIRRIAQAHLREPVELSTMARTATAANIRQRAWLVGGLLKLDALTRLLETEDFDGMIIFARTKIATEELAEKLSARGFAAAPLNGDIQQAQRERTVNRFRNGDLDILVATDVAARGLDVDRVSHVVNYDIPTDPESYVHRIGRTGRAGRTGEAILFVTARERHLLRAIERSTRQPIEAFNPPTADKVNDQRIARFFERIQSVLAEGDLEPFKSLLARFVHDNEIPSLDVAAALARAAQGDQPLLLQPDPPPPPKRERQPHPRDRSNADRPAPGGSPYRDRYAEQSGRGMDAPAAAGTPATGYAANPGKRGPRPGGNDELVPYRIEVGHRHGVQPGNIVGAIANEVGLDRRQIGRVQIEEAFSLVELPPQLGPEVLNHLAGVWVSGRQLRIRPDSGAPRFSARKTPAGKPDFSRPAKPGPKRFAPKSDRPPSASHRPSKPDRFKGPGKPAGKPPGKSYKPRGD